MTRILFIGDIVGKPGRQVLARRLPAILEQNPADLVIANGENAAGGFGITTKVAEEIFRIGVDAITLGNHAFDQAEAAVLVETESRIIRPANFRPDAPGRGVTVVEAHNGAPVALINLIGQVFMAQNPSPFEAVDEILATELPKVRFVDFHAETTSEKQAMGWHLDGRVSAMVGTHTHVPTADVRILPEGTGYQTDAGMTGPFRSVIGMKAEIALQRFVSYKSKAFQVSKGDEWVCGTWFEIDENGTCLVARQVQDRDVATQD